MNQILLDEGGNSYKLPHMGKNLLERQGMLPVSVGVVANPFLEGFVGADVEFESDDSDDDSDYNYYSSDDSNDSNDDNYSDDEDGGSGGDVDGDGGGHDGE